MENTWKITYENSCDSSKKKEGTSTVFRKCEIYSFVVYLNTLALLTNNTTQTQTPQLLIGILPLNYDSKKNFSVIDSCCIFPCCISYVAAASVDLVACGQQNDCKM